VVEAAYSGIAKAAELIDLEKHKGEHPRIGAADVVPFVPLSGISMDECVTLAKELGKRVGSELNIPVYLYEAAVTRPERKNLENIRRGEYEGLKKTIASDPAKEPDFGPKQMGNAGATVIGARPPLIAFNVYLETSEVKIAKEIAKKIRQSSGGLKFVKALGLLVEGRAQVSMNLTNFRETSLATVVEEIRQEAKRLGTRIYSSELVGLIPQEALFEAAQWYLQMDRFEHDQVLESRLYAAEQDKKALSGSFLDQLAANSPTPGGGSAAAYSGAMGASLVEMVAKLSMGKAKYKDIEPRMEEIIPEANAIRESLEKAVDEDAGAYQEVMQAYKLPKGTTEEQTNRQSAIEAGINKAVEVPSRVARLSTRTLELALEVAREGNQNAISDAGAAGAVSLASVLSAGMNVRINALSTTDKALAQEWIGEIEAIEQNAQVISQQIKAVLSERGGI
jgi:glutamate formiminotransferase/formiminotetrahydrofolate cyclodeaminase